MGKPKKKQRSTEEVLARKRENEKKRYEKIMRNPELYAEYKRKNKEKYQRRKQGGKVVNIHNLPPRAQRALRKQWRVESKKAYQRRKEKKMAIQRYIDGNSPPESDVDDVALQNMDNLNQNEPPEIIPSCLRSITPRTPLACSPISSSGSSACASPNARKMIRKLRYKKDKEIESLRHQLQSIKKLNDVYRKQLSRQQENNKRDLPVDQLSCSSQNNEYIQHLEARSEHEASDNSNSSRQDSALCKAVLQSYKSIASSKMKVTVTNILKPHLKKANVDKTSKVLLKQMFRRRHKTSKHVAASKRKKDVRDFLSDDGNSSCAAGKKEYVKKQGVKVQIRYLNDSLRNLYEKFLTTYKYRLSYAGFCSLKPFWILSASRRPRNTCLCVIHENFGLLVSALSKSKIIEHENTTKLLKSICCNINDPQCLLRKCESCKNKKVTYLDFDNAKELSYWAWNNKKEDIVTNKTKKTIRVVRKEKNITRPTDAVKTLENQIDGFLKHTGRIVSQQQAIKKIKNNLQTNEALVHVDFSENYKCAYGNEIQAAHFGGSKPQISIHTSVLYFFDANGQKRTQSFSTLSSNLRHDAAAVWAHMEPILQYLRMNAPQITYLHILSDSATSQYRNYKIFFVMSTLKWTSPRLRCINWHYSESGHGKGAPDGVGAVLKRTADAFVNQGRDIPDFETFSSLLRNKLCNIIIKIVTDENIIEKDLLFPSRLKTFKGTQQVHQAVWDHSKSSIALRRLTCTEETCLANASHCQHGQHIGFHFVRNQESSAPRRRQSLTAVSDGDNASDHSNRTEISTVANLERSSILSPLYEMELPSELRRTVLDNILTEDLENQTESPLSFRARRLFDSDSDESDYNIF